MATGSPVNYFHLSGRLCHTPTDFSSGTSFPYGGTNIGEFRDGVFAINSQHSMIDAEEFCGRRVDYVRRGDSAALVAVLREFDSDALSMIYPNVTTTTDSGRPRVESRNFGGSGNLPGSRVSSESKVLLFCPQSPNNVPAIILYNAIPVPEETGEIPLTIGSEAGFPVAFEGTHNSNGWVYQMALLSDMQLNPS